MLIAGIESRISCNTALIADEAAKGINIKERTLSFLVVIHVSSYY